MMILIRAGVHQRPLGSPSLDGSRRPVLGFFGLGWVPLAGSGRVSSVGPGGRFWAVPRPWEPNGRGNPRRYTPPNDNILIAP